MEELRFLLRFLSPAPAAQVWLRKVFSHYAVSDPNHRLMDICELIHAASELELAEDEQQLSSFVRTAVAEFSFLGVTTVDRLDVSNFVEVLFHFGEVRRIVKVAYSTRSRLTMPFPREWQERTHDGLCPSLARVENFMDNTVFPAVRTKTEIPLLC